jgi:hypothetical protein
LLQSAATDGLAARSGDVIKEKLKLPFAIAELHLYGKMQLRQRT